MMNQFCQSFRRQSTLPKLLGKIESNRVERTLVKFHTPINFAKVVREYLKAIWLKEF